MNVQKNTMALRLITYLACSSYRMLIVAVAGLLVSGLSFSQPITGKSPAQDAIQSYACAYAGQERLFLFLNSGFYYPGENLSFKAVLFDADMRIMTNGSRFFYLQLMDDSLKSIADYTFELHGGECEAQFTLPDTLLTGIYSLKAFTRWMQAYHPGNAFRRPLMIISPLNGETTCLALQDSLPVRFYPAGGNLLSGTDNEILVRVNPHYASSIRQLNIMNDLDSTLIFCSIDDKGTGVFSLLPERGRTYYAVQADSGQSGKVFVLPDQQTSGYNMNVKADKEFVHIHIASAGETEQNGFFYLVVMTGEEERSPIFQFSMVNRQAKVSIPLEEMSPGLNQLVLFYDQAVICSRVWYRKREQQPSTAMIQLKDTLRTRESVTANYLFPRNTVSGKIFAVSVNEYNPVTDRLFYNEISHFMYFDLYSSLLQYNRLPLFDQNTSEEYINQCLMAVNKTLALDFILNKRNRTSPVRETQGVLLTGRVVSSGSQLPVERAIMLLSTPDSIPHVSYSVTNEKGEFSFTLNEKLYNRQLYLMVEGHPQNTDPVSIMADDPFRAPASGMSTITLVHPEVETAIQSHKNIALSYSVFYRDKNRLPPPVKYTNPSYQESFYGKPDFVLIPAEYESLPDLFEIRKNLIPMLKLKIEDDYCTMMVFDDYLYLYPTIQAFVMLNNIPYPSFRNILELNSDLIRSIEIKKGRLYYDQYLMYGIISINTTKPVMVEPYYSNLITTVRVEKETACIPFMQTTDVNSLPDVRHSLYWEPRSYVIDETGKVQFSTSDIKGKYQLKIFMAAPDGSLHWFDKIVTVL